MAKLILVSKFYNYFVSEFQIYALDQFEIIKN